MASVALRPCKGWVIINYRGDVWLWTVSYLRRDAIRKAAEALPNTGWLGLEKQGCRAVKISVVAQ